MKLLFLTSRLPFPPHRGDRLRLYGMMQLLARRHEITLLSLVGSGAHMFSHANNPTLLKHLIIGGIGGVLLGTFAAPHIPKRPLRFALWVWLLVIGVQFLYTNLYVGH